MSAGSVLVAGTGPIATVTIAHPGRRNALTFAMWGDLAAAVARLGDDPAVRAIVLTGAGTDFAAGADIGEFDAARAGAAGVTGYDAAVAAAGRALADVRVPTLARIRGVCYGGALALAMACDLRLAADDAKFAIPAAKLGIGYPVADVARLVGLVGPARAREILFLGEAFDSAAAAAIGLVNRSVPVEDLDSLVATWGERIAGLAPLTHAATKAAVAAALVGGARDAAEAATAVCAASADYVEGRRAFLEKRPPRFTGR